MAAETLFLNSCQHVVANFWARVLCSLAAEDACFRMRNHSRSRPHSFPGFPRLCSGMFPEWFRNASVSVDSREYRLI